MNATDKKSARAERLARTLAELQQEAVPSSIGAVQFVATTARMEKLQEKVGSIPNRLKTMQKLISGLKSGKSSRGDDVDTSASASASASATATATATGANSRTNKPGGSPADKDKGKKTSSRPI